MFKSMVYNANVVQFKLFKLFSMLYKSTDSYNIFFQCCRYESTLYDAMFYDTW